MVRTLEVGFDSLFLCVEKKKSADYFIDKNDIMKHFCEMNIVILIRGKKSLSI